MSVENRRQPAFTSADERADSERRFEFGKNWRNFLSVLDEARIQEAEESLKQYLETDSLAGRAFLDIGSGSGLFSLAARRLGATVHSFDYDLESVACTRELKRRYFPEDRKWQVEQGSVLDTEYMQRIGAFDVVYSWGVLHHTGKMWEALKNASLPLAAGGKLFIAIYNHQRPWTAVWTRIKQTYNALPRLLRLPFAALVIAPSEARSLAYSLVRLDPGRYLRLWQTDTGLRGMNHWHDIIDWVGGLPFETATPEEIFDFYRQRGFTLLKLTTCGGAAGCNQYVFQADGGR